MKTILRLIRDWRIRRTKEALAYYSEKVRVLCLVCRHEHYLSDERDLCEASSLRDKLEARLANLEPRTMWADFEAMVRQEQEDQAKGLRP